MDPSDRELLQGMGNCFEACHASYDETIQMVAGSRDRAPAEVEATLRRLGREFGRDPEYCRLRARVPAEFPF